MHTIFSHRAPRKRLRNLSIFMASSFCHCKAFRWVMFRCVGCWLPPWKHGSAVAAAAAWAVRQSSWLSKAMTTDCLGTSRRWFHLHNVDVCPTWPYLVGSNRRIITAKYQKWPIVIYATTLKKPGFCSEITLFGWSCSCPFDPINFHLWNRWNNWSFHRVKPFLIYECHVWVEHFQPVGGHLWGSCS